LRILIATVAGLCAPFAAEPINFFTVTSLAPTF
jgi:hypothetical protein